jgi:cell wall-associated NlpC family hydrolase
MKRRNLLFSGLFVLFLFFALSPSSWASYYKVKEGDTLYSISKKFNISVKEIKQTNKLRKSTLRANQVIRIGKKSSTQKAAVRKARLSYYTVKKGDTLSKIAQKTHVPVKKLMAMNHINAKALKPGRKLLIEKATPVAGKRMAMPASDDGDDDEDADHNSDRESLFDGNAAADFSEEDNTPGYQEYLGKWNGENEVESLIQVATGFLGMPYRFGGSSLEGKGIDCSAFVQKIYRMFNVELPRSAREQAKVGVPIKKDELTEGDLVFFRTYRPFGHVGIYIGNNEFVHASTRGKIVRIDSMDMPFYKKRFQRAVRLKAWNEEGT